MGEYPKKKGVHVCQFGDLNFTPKLYPNSHKNETKQQKIKSILNYRTHKF